MENEVCVWGDLFDNNDQTSLKIGYFLTGLLSVVLGLWLNLSIVLTDLWHDPSYKNLSYFTRTALVRRIIAVVPFLGIIGRSGDSQPYCNIFAFLETFLAVFEIEWLTHVCIERYVVAKYVTNGWPMSDRHPILFKSLCVYFATLYSSLPLFGFGRYGLDFSCTSCTFDMILPDSWQSSAVIVTIYILRSIKPTIVMLTMLVWACILEENLKTSKDSYERRRFTRNIITLTLVNLFCWTPIAVIRGGVVLSQLVYSYPVILTSVQCIKWAMWLQWASPALNVIMLFIEDKKVRQKMLFVPNSGEDESKHNDQKNK